MSEAPHPAFGIPWAAKGEERPSQFQTPLAWVAGHEGGVLMVQCGEVDVDGCADRGWMTMSGWNRWVAEVKAAPFVAPAPDEQPWLDEEG